GVRIQGRVTDKVTGQPVAASVEYFAFAENPHHLEVPGFATDHYLQTDADGAFALIGLPGRGLIAVRARSDRYLMAVGADQIKGRAERGLFPTVPHLCHDISFHTLVEINPDPGAAAFSCAVTVDPGRTLTGTVLGPDGQPLAWSRAYGLKGHGMSWENQP